MVHQKIDGAVAWYSENRSRYETLARTVKEIIKENLNIAGIDYLDVTYRTKTVDSYKRKILKKNYEDPISENKDYAGIRVIIYIDSEAKKALALIKDLFDINPEHVVDKSDDLGIDKVGYRSIQTEAELLGSRCELPEFKRFKGMYFEIQIRTILQHAWAEIEHDRNYKFSGVLPKEIQRRFKILAGLLELADREFDEIAKSIDAYSETVSEKANIGDLAIPINSTSLKEYMNKKFETLIKSGYLNVRSTIDEDIIGELKNYGIISLDQLDKIVPNGIIDVHCSMKRKNFYIGLIRDILIINDPEAYFEKAWNENWRVTYDDDIPFYKKYGIDLKSLSEKYRFDLAPVMYEDF